MPKPLSTYPSADSSISKFLFIVWQYRGYTLLQKKICIISLASAEALADRGLQETSAFCSYHAFESLGGVVCAHLGQTYPRGHDKKVNQFVASSARIGISHSVSVLAIAMRSLGRNNLLYPNPLPSGDFEIPEQKLTSSNATDLFRRVKGLKKRIERII